jgi:3-dehydrosphinganine reductase
MFAQKSIIVTGASKGIGREISKELARQGARLSLVARTSEDLITLQNELRTLYPRVEVEIFPTDVTHFQAVQELVQKCIAAYGTIDGIISNAGYAYPQYFEETPLEEFQKQVQVNFFGAVHLVKTALPYLKKGSFISFTSSVLGYMGCYGYSSYSPTKYALIGFAECLRQELTPRGIQVSVLCPPDTLTPGYARENLTKPQETLELSKNISAMKPEDVAMKFIQRLGKGDFLINCNFESQLMYRLKMLMPEAFQKISLWMLKKVNNQIAASRPKLS